MSTYIGIDPGKNGGIAIIESSGFSGGFKMPATMHGIWQFIDGETYITREKTAKNVMVLVEKLGQMPRKNGKALQSPTSTGKLYRNYGHIEMALTAAGIPFDEILPAKWQQPFGLLRQSKSESQTAKKNRHKEKAQQLFPDIKVTHAIADALLIAETCRRFRAE